MTNRRIHRVVVLIGLTMALIFNSSSVFATVDDTDLEFKIQEVMTVVVTTPDTGATGDVNQFLRNKYTLSVNTNANGFTASMTAKAHTANLVNIASYSNIIPTLSTNYTRSNFPTNYWGYSLDDTTNGNNSSTYRKVAALGETPNTILTVSGSGSGSQDVYFGTKANSSKASGKYLATVIFNVVTDVITPDNPIIPEDPTVPSGSPSYDASNDTTSYTTIAHSGSGSSSTTTTTTEVSGGDNRTSYTPPQGVTSTTTTNIGEGTPLATGLVITSTVAAASGIAFFIIAKRRKDDEDEEEEEEID